MARFLQIHLEDPIADLLVRDRDCKIFGIELSEENDEIKITLQKEVQ